jgi:hypothetical protein
MDLLLRRVILGAGAIAAVTAFAASQVAGAGRQTSLGVEGALNSNVSVAAAGARVVLTWAARSGAATDVYAAFSQDGGVSFGPPLRVNDVSGDARVSGEQAPRVGVGERVAVAWESRQAGLSLVRTASATSGAKAFTPAVNVHPDALAGARGWASLAVSPRGTVHVAWLDGRGDGAAAASAAPAAAAASAAGARHAMRQDLFQAVLTPDGARHEVRLATNVCFCCKTAVAAGSDGAVYVAWRHIYPPNLRDIAVARSDDGGRTFGQPSRVSEDGWAIDGCPDDGPSLAVDARGGVHVAWPTWVAESDRKGIFYSYSADGGRSFAPRLRVDDAKGGAAHPQLAVAPDRVVVVWDEAGAGARRVRMREIAKSADRGWAPREGSSTGLSAEGQAATYPSVAASGDGVVVAWSQEAEAGSQIRVERLAR